MNTNSAKRLHTLCAEWFHPESEMWQVIQDVIQENNTLRRINDKNLEKLDHAQRLAQMVRDSCPKTPEGTEVYIGTVAKKLARKRNNT